MGTTILLPPEKQEPIQGKTEDEILDGTQETEFEPLLPGLTAELERDVIGIVLEFERESYATWRWNNRDWLEAESFW